MHRLRSFVLIFVFGLSLLVSGRILAAPAPFALNDGDRVVFIGDTLIEREQYHGWIELMLTTHSGGRNVTFRNLGWSADTPAGASRFGLSLMQAGREPADEGWNNLVKQIEEAKPTVAFIGYGMASSFGGDAGLPSFKAEYVKLIDALRKISPGARLVLLAPIPHENLGAPWPDAAPHNAQLAAYAQAVGGIAVQQQAHFVPLFNVLIARPEVRRTSNGIHPTDTGYRSLAEVIEEQLLGGRGANSPTVWRNSRLVEPLRQAILRKNEWFFHRSRPANMAYIFGFRKREQGNNATEVLQFDEFIAAEEKRIAHLRALQPVTAPEIPRRRGNAVLKFTPQPHPQFETGDGIEVTLWAENPLLNKPIQMNFDARGRLWVASSELYPQIEPGQAATDKIVVLEDTTGAGRADKATVFAEGLLIPTGVAPGDGGVYVAQSTELLHFQDTDGDGKADERRSVLSGFGTEDTHHNLHTLRWGPDGRLYMNQAVYTRTDSETPHGVVRLKAGGVFRFDPRDQRMEIAYRGLVNGWGHQVDDFGQSFLTDGAGLQGIYWGVPGATMQTLAPARRVLESISPGRYPKFAGIELIRSAHFPADWQGDVVTADFRAHRIVRFKVSNRDAGFVTKEMPDLMRTTADSFRPIDLRIGPDGALYIADWSNPIIQHGEVDFRDTRRDKAHGRIWRVTMKGRPALAKTDLTKLADGALLERLRSSSGYDQEQAKRVLVERGAQQVLPALAAWTQKQRSETDRLQALWAYQAINHSPSTLANELIAAKDPRVRAAAVRALPAEGALTALEKLVQDGHPRVRLEAIRALGRLNSARAAELALSALELPMDSFLDYAVWLTINELAAPWLAAVKSGAWKLEGREKQLEFALKAVNPALASEVLGQLIAARGVPRDGAGPWIELIGLAGGPAELDVLLNHVVRGELTESAALRGLTALGNAARLRSERPTEKSPSLRPLLEANREPIRIAALQLAGAWQLADSTLQIARAAGNLQATPAERTAAFTALRDIGGEQATAGLKELASAVSPLPVRREAVVALASLDLPMALPEIVAVLKSTFNEADAQILWRALLSVRGVSGRLATELPKTDLPRVVAQAGLRPAREGTQHSALVPVLLKSAGLSLSEMHLSPGQMQQLAQEALAKGDAARGEQIYRRVELACVTCHAIGGAGGKLGPDLTSIGASAPPDYIVEALLYPSAKIKEGYHSALISTKDGQELSGMIAQETATEIILRNAANQDVSIPIQNIARRTSVGSLMPAGLIDTLLPEERLDLIKFLTQLGKAGGYDAAKGGVARAWKLYLMLSSNQHLGVERVVQGDFALPDWRPAFSLVNGALAKEVSETEYPTRINNRGLFAATQFDSARGGAVNFQLSGDIRGIWVNGQRVKAHDKFSADVKPGTNTIVVQLNDVTPTDIKLTSTDVSFVLAN